MGYVVVVSWHVKDIEKAKTRIIEMKTYPDIGFIPNIEDTRMLPDFFMKKGISAKQAIEIFPEDIVLKFPEFIRVEWFSFFKICRLPASRNGLEKFAKLIKSKVVAYLFEKDFASLPCERIEIDNF